MLFSLVGERSTLDVPLCALPNRASPVFAEIERSGSHEGQRRGVRRVPQPREVETRRETAFEVGGQRFEIGDVAFGVARSPDAVVPTAELANVLPEIEVSVGIQIGRQGSGIPVAPPRLGEIAQEFLGSGRILSRHHRDRIIGRTRLVETIAPPMIEDRVEYEIGLIAIENFGARINRRLDGVGPQQVVAESVDRRAGQFVQ